MKWNQQNKNRLYAAFTKKAEQLEATIPEPGEERDGQWELFLKSHGIVRAERDDPNGYYSRFDRPRRCRNPAWRSLEDDECLADRKRILIEDPYYNHWVRFCAASRENKPLYQQGLSVPKDIAEKILVLGVP